MLYDPREEYPALTPKNDVCVTKFLPQHRATLYGVLKKTTAVQITPGKWVVILSIGVAPVTNWYEVARGYKVLVNAALIELITIVFGFK